MAGRQQAVESLRSHTLTSVCVFLEISVEFVPATSPQLGLLSGGSSSPLLVVFQAIAPLLENNHPPPDLCEFFCKV